MADITSWLDDAWCQQITARVAEILDTPLLPTVYVTAQRMQAGQQARVHTDRPLAGYEAARFILQLKSDWQYGDGGVFQTHRDASGETISSKRPPRRNQGLGFCMGNHSYHSVSPAGPPRHTVVFNFWHPANPPDLGTELDRLFERCHFGELPAAIEHLAIDAEARLDPDVTYRASLVAWLLQRWQAAPSTVVQGYRLSLDGLDSDETDPTDQTQDDHALGAIMLAQWLVRCFTIDVCLERWARINQRVPALCNQLTGSADTWCQRLFPGSLSD
jgi:hypothetical protein